MDSLISSCIDPFVGLLKDRVLKHLFFVVEAGHYVESLDRRAELLDAKRKDVLERIRADEPLGKKPTNVVEAWLRDADAVHQRAQSIIREYDGRDCVFPGTSSCSFNLFANHHFGRRAAEELSNVETALQNMAEIKEITTEVLPPPAQEMPTTTLTDACGYEIRRKLKMALDFLRDDAKGSLGVWGMGGVGKTTLLEHVNDSLATHPSTFGFHHVVFLTASRECTVGKIQELLSKKLGLNDIEQIFGYLSKKSFVLLLDDLWDPLDLKQAGIPLPFGTVGQFRRKLILTTRSRQVCHAMGVRAIIEVECLSRDAARRLFRDKAGEDAINSHPLIPQLADEVADECDGLPLALITIGSAMAGNQTVQVWQNAARLLRDSKLSKIPGMVDPLPLLKFSYDHLKDPTEQQCFLHCALWPEDKQIRKEDLIECWMGHGLLEDDVADIEDVYNQGYAIIDSLQKACLLESTDPGWGLKNERVKLHDVIRDMALFIARDCGKNGNKWMMLEGARELPHDTRVWSEVHKLSVWKGSIEGFPSGLQSCHNLTTLFLYRASLSSSVGAVKHFSHLRYLNLIGCDSREEFPIEMCSLIKLEYLSISYTRVRSLPNELKNLRNLKYFIAIHTRISCLPDGLLANLVSLLYLDLFSYLRISQSSIIDDLNCVNGRPKALGIIVSAVSDIKKLVRLDNMCIRRLRIQRMEGIASLRLLSGDVLGRKHMHSNLKHLHISDCVPTFEELVVDEEHHLSNLNRLKLFRLFGLKEVIWKGVEPQNVLPNLRMVHIEDCPLLKHATWIINLPCLELLWLKNCGNMKHLFWVEALEIAEPHKPFFPSLRSLNLSDLPNLDGICHHALLAFPSLEHISVRCCAMLTKLSFQSPPSLRHLKEIRGEIEWWNNLEMDDDMRNFLQPFYVTYPSHTHKHKKTYLTTDSF